MNSNVLSDWLCTLSTQERVRSLALMYSGLTIGTRQLFLPDMPIDKNEAIIKMLHGVNEIHHTLANWFTASTANGTTASVEVLARQLVEIADKYHIGGLLVSAVEFAQSRNRR